MRHEEGVAIGRLLRHVIRADDAAGSRPVLHQHILAECRRKRRRDQARDGVHQAAWGELRHQADRRAAWPGGLRVGNGGGCQKTGGGTQKMATLHHW